MSIPTPQQHNQDVPLVGFTRNVLYAAGTITLCVTWGDNPNKITKPMKLFVIDAPSAYNVIFGRQGLNTM